MFNVANPNQTNMLAVDFERDGCSELTVGAVTLHMRSGDKVTIQRRVMDDGSYGQFTMFVNGARFFDDDQTLDECCRSSEEWLYNAWELVKAMRGES